MSLCSVLYTGTEQTLPSEPVGTHRMNGELFVTGHSKLIITKTAMTVFGVLLYPSATRRIAYIIPL